MTVAHAVSKGDGMKGLIALLLLVLLAGCGRLLEYTTPSPRDLLAHAGWFDGRKVSVCGNVRHGLDSCTLEICADGDDTCAKPLSAWISTKSTCYTGKSAAIDKAIVSGRFLDFSDARQEHPSYDYAIAGADVTFVTGCDAGGSEPAPAVSVP